MPKKVFTLIITAIFCVCSFAQTSPPDSLLKTLKKTDSKSEKINMLLNLSEFYYKQSDFSKSVIHSTEGIKLAKRKKDLVYKMAFLKLAADSYFMLSDFDSSLKFYEELYQTAEKAGNNKNKGVALTGYLKNYRKKGQYKKAVIFGSRAIKTFEKIGDTNNINIVKLNLASVYLDIKDYKSADKIYDELLNDKNTLSDTLFTAEIFDKKGIVQFNKSLYPLARKYYSEAHRLYELKNEKLFAAIEIGHIAETYEMEKKYAKAIKLYKYAIDTEIKYNYYSGLIFLYEALGRSYIKTNQYKKAKEYYLKALSYIELTKENRELPRIYDMLHILYAETGDYKKAYKYALSTMKVRDSILGENVQNQIYKIKINYETKKAEKENEFLKIKQKEQKEKNRTQLLIISIISVLMIFILFFAFLLNKFNNKNKKIKQMLSVKNKKLNEAYTDIRKSIDYAGKIQFAMLSSYADTLKNFSEYIILYKPAYTLSGDFYWSKKINNTIFVAVADSTGHGVPGALLSITGMSFLNEIVTEDFIQTDTVLNNLRSKIKHRLKQEGDFQEYKDGWDMSIFSFNIKTYECQFSGAYNSLYVISKNESPKKLTKYKADRQPVGIYCQEQPFRNQRFKLNKGDLIWMFTDGFADQFNDSGKKKYTSKRLKKLLLSVCEKPLSTQKDILNRELKKWKGDFEQVDDILITGIKI